MLRIFKANERTFITTTRTIRITHSLSLFWNFYNSSCHTYNNLYDSVISSVHAAADRVTYSRLKPPHRYPAMFGCNRESITVLKMITVEISIADMYFII